MDTFEWLAKLMVILAMGAGTVGLVRVAVFGGWRHRRGGSSGAEPAELAGTAGTLMPRVGVGG